MLAPESNEYEYIFVKSFFHKKLGRRIHAHECGKRLLGYAFDVTKNKLVTH